MADDSNANEGRNPRSKGAKADKKQSRWNAFLFLLIPMMGILLPRHYKGIAPLLFLIPLVISFVNKFRNTDDISGASSPNRDRAAEPYLNAPKDPKDPRRYRPIG